MTTSPMTVRFVEPRPQPDTLDEAARVTGRDPAAIIGGVVAMRMRQSFRASGPERRRLMESALAVASMGAHRGI
jgi:hypothetical protein